MGPSVLLLHCPGDKVFLHDYYTSYSSKANYYWPPTDLILLSGVLRDERLTVIDAIAERLNPEACLARIRAAAPDVIIFTTGTATWEPDFAFLAEVRRAVPARIVASGSIFLFEAERFLARAPHVDAAITDITGAGLLEYIRGLSDGRGALAVRRPDGSIAAPAPACAAREFDIPVPRHDLFPFRANRSPLARRRPFSLVVTSIGCPFGCVFCVAGAVAYRTRRLDGVLDELETLRGLGVREIMFNDPTLTVSKKRVLELCRGLEARGLKYSWICNAHISTLDDEMAAAMRQAGCHAVMIGVESGADEILAATEKKASVAKAIEAFRVCRRQKIRTLAYFIVGLPGETAETVEQTIHLAKTIDPDYASFTVLTPDVGSPLRRKAVEQGLLDPDTLVFDSTGPPVFLAGRLSGREVWALHRRAVRAFYIRPAYVWKRLTGIRSLRDVRMLASNALALLKHS